VEDKLIIAVDIDHTLRLSHWRDEHIEWAKESGEWDTYHSLGIQDKPATQIIELVVAMHRAGHEIYVVTAIPRKWLRPVFSWLHKHGIKVEHDHLLMRPLGDDQFRPSPELKQELVAHLDVDLFIDDREDVCSSFASIGVTTLQVRLVS